MKKKLQAELISIAHRILKLKNPSTLPQLKEEARQLYEKLSILSFAETHINDPKPTIGQIEVILDDDSVIENVNTKQEIASPKSITKIKDNSEKEINISESHTNIEAKESGFSKSEIKGKPELIIEEINASISGDLFVPVSTPSEGTGLSSAPLVSNLDYDKKDKENSCGESKEMFIQDKVNTQEEKPKSLNDQLKKGIHIGLNDRLAFIKHLFDGSSTDYNRVLSQLNTLNNLIEAKEFVQNIVKPDYNNWEGKEEYEERFISIVQNKFDR